MSAPEHSTEPGAALDGLWFMRSAEFSGDAAPELFTRKATLQLAGGLYTVRFDGAATDEGEYILAADAPASALVITGRKGPNAGRTIPAIYRFTADSLEICYGFDGQRPTGFLTHAGTPWYLGRYSKTRL